jgi:hypothetical protein
MECKDIQRNLSAYRDGVSSAEEKGVIEEHLKSCKACRTSLEDLEKTLSYVKNLNEIEPPAWLTQKVMTRVREEAVQKEGIVHKLFYPLHIKVPVQAIATILIAVSAFYIFKTIQPDIKPSMVAVDEMATPKVLLEDKEESSKRAEIDKSIPTSGQIPDSIVTADRPQRDREIEKDTAVSKEKVVSSLEGKEIERFSSAKEEEVMTHEFRKPLPAEPMKQLYHAEDLETADMIEGAPRTQEPTEKQESMKASVDFKARDELEAGGISLRAGKLAGEKEQYPDITLTVDSLENSQEDVEKIVEQLGGKIIKTERFEDKMLVVVRCDAPKANELLEQLRLVGEIKEEGFALEKREGQREIGIELVEK